MTPILAAAVVLASPVVPGSSIAPFDVRALDGQVVHWRPGKPTMLTVFAFWCDTWKTHLPRMEQARRGTKTLPIDYLAVCLDGRWSSLAPARPGVPVALDHAGTLRRRLGIDRIPATFAIDPDGKVRWAAYGTVRTEDMVRAAQRLLEPSTPKSLSLTFDDFPTAQAELLLDELRRLDVQATFFVLCNRAKANKAVLTRAVREGHTLQIHGWAHEPGPVDVERCQKALREVAGVRARWLRPPGSAKMIPLAGQATVPANAAPFDHLVLGTGELVRRVLLKAKPDGVVQLHDGNAATRRDLEALVDALRQAGYGLEPLR